jgi:hypothetical protein
MNKEHFRLTTVEVLDEFKLYLAYADGQTFIVDLSALISSQAFLVPLKERSLFTQAKVGLGGYSVDWIEDELDLGSDNLRHLGVEQSGGIGHERIWTWLHETGLTLEQAAEELGISRRMLIYYRDGEKSIPRTIWLACLGWQAIRPQGRDLPLHAPSAMEYAALHS